MYDILILSHALDMLDPNRGFTINLMARRFEESGLKVCYQKGLTDRPEARLVINQVALTVTPLEYIQFFQHYPKVLNGRLTDISKQIVCQDTLVKRGDGYHGPVIVKTKLNYGGLPELAVLQAEGRMKPGQDLKYDWLTVPYLAPQDYPIHNSPDRVPPEVWYNPHLVVQRYVTERDKNGQYCLRSWYVLGDRGFHVVTLSDGPVVRGNTIKDRKVVTMQTPARLEQLRSRMGVDFGRFDYVQVGGDVIIFDVNRTPTSTPGAVEHYKPQWREMALGINQYLQ